MSPAYKDAAKSIVGDAMLTAVFIVALSGGASLFFQSSGPLWIGLVGMLVAQFIFIMAIVGITDQVPVNEPSSADPWATQRRMMEISGQEIAERPVLNKTGVLYGALILEEGAETMAGLASTLVAASRMSASDQQHDRLYEIAQTFAFAERAMSGASKSIRKDLAQTSPFELRLAPADALELFDGTTDITVVNCGFALAIGVPGAAGYDEVQRSNLSKADPETGLILKDPGGKWIKGPDYFPPALDDVLQAEAYVKARSEPVGMGM